MNTVTLIFLFLLAIIIAACVYAVYIYRKGEKASKAKMEAYRLRLTEEIESKKYVPTMKIEHLISADYKNKRWRPEIFANCKTFSFSEISGFELIENGNVISASKSDGVVSRALVGDMLAGSTGAVIGAATAPTYTVSENVVNKRVIRISLTNPSINHMEILIPELSLERNKWGNYTAFTTNVVKNESEPYSVNGEEAAWEIISLLESISEIGKKTVKKADRKVEAIDVIEEIKRYKQLYDDGAISEEEFTLKKKQLMNI